MIGVQYVKKTLSRFQPFKKFKDWATEFDELGGATALFGYNTITEKLVDRFPDSFSAVVDLKPENKGKTIRNLTVIDFEKFRNELTRNVIITDTFLQYEYLKLLYAEMYSLGVPLIGYNNEEKIRIRYDYVPYKPELFDSEYLKIKKTLPMQCNFPHNSLIRIIDFVKTSYTLDGDFVEIGTGLGCSTYFISSVLESLGADKIVYTVDKFEPLYYIPNLNYETVSKNLSAFPFVKIVKGVMPEILYDIDVNKIAFCFFDFYPTPEILAWLYPKMTKGAVILIDNYTHGCTINHGMMPGDLFFRDKKEKIIRLGDAQGLVVKQ